MSRRSKSRKKSRKTIHRMLRSLPVLIKGTWSDNPVAQLAATTLFRKLLAIVRKGPIEEVISAGVVPRFVEFLGRHDMPQLQFEASWALTNIAAGKSEHTQVVIKYNSVHEFLKLLSSSNDKIRGQAIWALSNIAGESPTCRDLILNNDALGPLLAELKKPAELSLRTATWALLNFCRGKPPPRFELLKPALPTLQHLIDSTDKKVVARACRALSFLLDGQYGKIQAVIEEGVCPRLVELLHHPSREFVNPTLQILLNIISGDGADTQVLLKDQVLPCLYQLLTEKHKKEIKKSACRAISNITGGTTSQIQAVIDANIIPHLVRLAQDANFANFGIKKEAVWAIANATCGQSSEQNEYLVNQGCLKPLCDLLICPDPSIVVVCLKGLENILQVGEAAKDMEKTDGVNIYAQMIVDIGGLDKIKNLQTRENDRIYEKAAKILKTYYLTVEVED